MSSFLYQPQAWKRAQKIAPTTKHGDTILMDFWITYKDGAPSWVSVQYLENVDGKLVSKIKDCKYNELGITWTHQVTDLPFY